MKEHQIVTKEKVADYIEVLAARIRSGEPIRLGGEMVAVGDRIKLSAPRRFVL